MAEEQEAVAVEEQEMPPPPIIPEPEPVKAMTQQEATRALAECGTAVRNLAPHHYAQLRASFQKMQGMAEGPLTGLLKALRGE